jgi:hypothetical protein
MLLVYWIYQCLKYKGALTVGIALSKRQILFLILSEILLFCVLFLFYYLNQDPDTANSFAWQNMFFYFRGVLPVMALNSFDDNAFRFLSNPTWECLIAVLIIDYIALLITTRFKKK